MTFKAASTASSNFKRPDPVAVGTYPARLVQMIDLGVQTRRPYKGEAKDPIQMIRTTYELTTEFMKNEDGTDDTTKPRWISEDFPLYKSLIGNAFPLYRSQPSKGCLEKEAYSVRSSFINELNFHYE